MKRQSEKDTEISAASEGWCGHSYKESAYLVKRGAMAVSLRVGLLTSHARFTSILLEPALVLMYNTFLALLTRG